MTNKIVVAIISCYIFGGLAAHATSAPFGSLSAYNLVALSGNIVGPTTADNEGRVAAAGQFTNALNIGTNLGSDPWGSLANGYAMVAGGGVNVAKGSAAFNINGGGGVWAKTNNATYNFNDGKTLTVGGTSPIDFATEQTAMQTLNTNLSGLTANGTMGTVSGGNPSWTGLYGTSSTLNVFTLTAAQLSSDYLDFVVPGAQSAATIIVNVIGTAPVLNNAILVNGTQEGDSNDDNNLILFNFENASSVTINGQFDAALLAPNAVLSSTDDAQMGGNFIVGSVGQTGEVHNDEFQGTIPLFSSSSAAPEPGTFTLMSSGFLFLAALLFRRRQTSTR